MSDIHGCYCEFMEVLEKIDFSKEDRLIIAGDYIDRGTQNLEMLQWIENKPNNVILLKGNHEVEFSYYIKLMKTVFAKRDLPSSNQKATELVYELVKEMAATGEIVVPFDYYGTIKELIYDESIVMDKLLEWSDCIEKMPFVYKNVINGRNVVVVHAGYIENLNEVETEKYFENLEDFYIYARDDAYVYGGIKQGMVIAGHTPTVFEDELPYNEGNVYRSYDEEMDCLFYNIDCGCAYKGKFKGAKMACLCIETEKVTYGNLENI